MNFRRTLASLGAAAVIAAVAPLATSHAEAATTGPCSAGTGVTVVVDFSHWGGAIERGCALGHPGTGLDALHAAGFSTAGTAQYGNAFLCRIDNKPDASAESCTSTPPGDAFWAYYHAQPTDSGWTYNSLGATSTHPAVGSIEAWAFGGHALPGISPAAAVAVAPPPTIPPATLPPPTTAPPATNSSGARVRPHANSGTTVAGAHSSTPLLATPTTIAGSSAATTTPKSHAPRKKHSAAAATSRNSTTTIVDAPRVVDKTAAPPAASHDSGSPVPTGLTIVLLVAIAVVVSIIVRARGQSGGATP